MIVPQDAYLYLLLVTKESVVMHLSRQESIRLKGIESNSEVVIYNTLGMMVKTVNANAEQEISVSVSPRTRLAPSRMQTARMMPMSRSILVSVPARIASAVKFRMM